LAVFLPLLPKQKPARRPIPNTALPTLLESAALVAKRIRCPLFVRISLHHWVLRLLLFLLNAGQVLSPICCIVPHAEFVR